MEVLTRQWKCFWHLSSMTLNSILPAFMLSYNTSYHSTVATGLFKVLFGSVSLMQTAFGAKTHMWNVTSVNSQKWVTLLQPIWRSMMTLVQKHWLIMFKLPYLTQHTDVNTAHTPTWHWPCLELGATSDGSWQSGLASDGQTFIRQLSL